MMLLSVNPARNGRITISSEWKICLACDSSRKTEMDMSIIVSNLRVLQRRLRRRYSSVRSHGQQEGRL